MSAGGSRPIDNQSSPSPSLSPLPPADYSMGYARNFQTPSFFNPFSGYYGANTGMGGFQSQFGGFQPQFGGFGGFGGFQQPQYGGFQQPQYGGFQQPQYGGFQQQQFGGFGGGFQQPQQFQQPFDGGYGGGFQQPFSGGFGRQSNRFTRRGQEYTQPYNPPQPNQPDYGNMNQFNQPQQAQRGTVDQNMNNPAFKQQQDAYNMTDYQRLMQRKDSAANAPPAPPMSGLVGLGGMPVTAPRDIEIANSLGFKSPNTGIYMQTDYNPERNRRLQQQDEVLAKEYLSSIGYGQSGFDPSKYEVKREVQPFSGIGSLFSGLGRGFA